MGGSLRKTTKCRGGGDFFSGFRERLTSYSIILYNFILSSSFFLSFLIKLGEPGLRRR